MLNTAPGGGGSSTPKKKKKSGGMLGGIADAASSAVTSAANSVNRASGGSGLSSYRTPSYARTPRRNPGPSGPTLADVLSGIQSANLKNRPQFTTPGLDEILAGAKETADVSPQSDPSKNDYTKNQVNDLSSLVGLNPKTGKPLDIKSNTPLTPYSRKLKRQQARRDARLDGINPQYPEGFDPKHPNWMPLGQRIAVPENVKKQWSTKTWWLSMLTIPLTLRLS